MMPTNSSELMKIQVRFEIHLPESKFISSSAAFCLVRRNQNFALNKRARQGQYMRLIDISFLGCYCSPLFEINVKIVVGYCFINFKAFSYFKRQVEYMVQ